MLSAPPTAASEWVTAAVHQLSGLSSSQVVFEGCTREGVADTKGVISAFFYC